MSHSNICITHGNVKPCWPCLKTTATRKAKSGGNKLDRVKAEIVAALESLRVTEDGEGFSDDEDDGGEVDPFSAAQHLLKALAELRKVS